MLSPDESAALIERQAHTDVFETLIEQFYGTVLSAGDTAVDGGAHAGLHTLPLARIVGPSGTVHAYEPMPTFTAELRAVVANLPQVQVHENALTDREGSIDFHVISAEPALSGIAKRDFGSIKPFEVISVACARLDSLTEGNIRFVKLDLESGEYHALNGGRRMIARCRPFIMMECGRADAANAAGYTEAEFFGLFESIGYTLHDLFGRPFAPADFSRQFNDALVPHYLLASPRGQPDQAEGLTKRARKQLAASA